MRIVLVGTELAPVRTGAGALETLLAGWAVALATSPHRRDVTVCSVVDRENGAQTGPLPYAVRPFARPEDLSALMTEISPDAVILNNRPDWQRFVRVPTLHLLHNWPDAWVPQGGAGAAAAIGAAGTAAVSAALAKEVAAALGRDAGDVGVVSPFVGAEMLAAQARPEAGLVLSPNRLMRKKGVLELVAAAPLIAASGGEVWLTDHISPWTEPTAEHLALRAAVRASPHCRLVPPPGDRAAMAALYARAEVVVCPSTHPEGLGLAAIEAQAVGVPVVSSGRGGLLEATLRPELVADPGDAPALAATIRGAAGLDRTTRERLRTEARRRYSLDRSVRSLLRLLDSRGRLPG